MQALRGRFQPELQTNRHKTPRGPTPHANLDGNRVTSRDYFTYVPSSPTVKATSVPSATPRNPLTPAASHDRLASSGASSKSTGDEEERPPPEPLPGGSSGSVAQILSPDAAGRHTNAFVRRTSAMRKQVGAGDLAMTRNTGPDETGGAWYRPTAQTPGLPRMDTWRGRVFGSTVDLSQLHHGQPLREADENALEDEWELREAVLACIAKSIGLVSPAENGTEPITRSSVAPSVSALSTPNSPLFLPNGRGNARSPFGNVLDMMNAQTQHDGLIGGMLREAVMNARPDEDASSVSASLHDSQMHSGMGGMGSNPLKDLEGKVEILLFKKGNTLVKEGEKSPGIYFVIDGFLDVSR